MEKKKIKKFVGIEKNYEIMFVATVCAGEAGITAVISPILAQFQVSILAFSRQFNKRTEMYLKGVPLPVRIWVEANKEFQFDIGFPTMGFYLKQMAFGLEFGFEVDNESKSVVYGDEIPSMLSMVVAWDIIKIVAFERGLTECLVARYFFSTIRTYRYRGFRIKTEMIYPFIGIV